MLKRLNQFSLPIAASAACLALAVEKLAGLSSSNESIYLYVTLLFFTTLGVYNFDHFLDSKNSAKSTKQSDDTKNPSTSTSPPNNGVAAVIAFVCVVATLSAGYLLTTNEGAVKGYTFLQRIALEFKPQQWWLISTSVLLVGVHFFAYHFALTNNKIAANFKELSVATIFCFAIVMPLTLANYDFATTFFNNNKTVVGAIFLTLLHNALLFTFFNYKKDKAAGRKNIVENVPKELVGKSYTMLGLLALIMTLSYPPLAASPGWKYLLPFYLMTQGILFRMFIRSTQFFETLHGKENQPPKHNFHSPRFQLFLFVGNIHFAVWYLLFLLLP